MTEYAKHTTLAVMNRFKREFEKRVGPLPRANRPVRMGGHFELTDDEQNRERLDMCGWPHLSPTTNQLRQREELAVATPNHKSEIPQNEQTLMEFELTEEKRRRGWTPENKAEYLRETENVQAVYVEAP